MKTINWNLIVIVLLGFVCNTKLMAQSVPYKIAVFAPVYLDSAFDGNDVKPGNTLSKNILPGLDFYNGVMLAVDSLQNEGIQAEVYFYDLKNAGLPLHTILEQEPMQQVSLIIAAFNNIADIKTLAGFAAEKKIPLISSTLPNNGGVSGNPYFTVINPTLKTHCEELYKYLQRNFSTNTILFFKRKGAVENWILSAFSDIARNTPSLPLKMKTIELSDTFTVNQALQYLDSTRKNILICGSLNENFSIRLVKSVSLAAGYYNTTIVGMPNWDALRDLDKSDCKAVDIIYTTPYNFNRNDKTIIAVTNKYRTLLNGRPGDMVFKGYESMYHFTKLLEEHGKEMNYYLSEKKFKLFNDFDIRPVINKTNRLQTDYLENRKLYFIKKNSGQIKSIS